MPAPGSLIGRDQELGSLSEQLRNAIAGGGALILLSGEAGVGKTRLLETLCEGTDAPVLRGAARQETVPEFTQDRKVEPRIRQLETQQILPVDARADRLRRLTIR